MIKSTEYLLQLNTGEDIQVCEIDSQVIPDLLDNDVKLGMKPILELCSYIPRAVVEEAKLGDSRQFQKLMRTPPIGAMLRLNPQWCGARDECASWDRKTCTTRNVLKNLGSFPICWEFEITKETPETLTRQIRDIAYTIVHAWREGRYVVLVTS